MSSGFVSGGTIEKPIERDEAWLTAQKEVEANHRRKAELARQNDGKSLFETLEANKAAKQEAFEEAAKLKHQFQSLNEDEAEFLDSILERTRADEDRVKKETQEGLALFRQQQEEADKKARRESGGAAVENTSIVDGDLWTAGRKRKRAKEKEGGLKGVKVRRSSTATESTKPPPESAKTEETTNKKAVKEAEVELGAGTANEKTEHEASLDKATSPTPAKSALGLVDYGSDEDNW